MKKILVPIDGSEQSNAAVDWACELAALCEAEMILLHIDENNSGNAIITRPGQVQDHSIPAWLGRIQGELIPGFR